ncbi:MAG: endonuclease/exonuclease/phosphatase family protein [Deltaproteobacteria bacterium]
MIILRNLMLALMLGGTSLLGACSGSDNSGPTGDFVALSYNVAGLPEALSGSQPATFMPLIGPLLNDYDLVLVQESWLTPDPNPFAPLRVYHEILMAASTQLFQSVPGINPLNNDLRRPEATLGDGLNRFSRFSFEPVTRIAWDGCDNTSADCLAFKGFSFARTTLADGVIIDVYNLHMEAGGSANDDALRAAGVEQMLAQLNGVSAGRAVIIGGDFNLHTDDEPDSTTYGHLLEAAGLVDVCAALECPETGRIDKFAFRSGGGVTLEPTSWNFENDVFVSAEGEPLSDHDALAVRFRWATD